MSRIDGYQFGRVLVDGHEETRDVIVLPHRVVRNWWRKDGHALALEDLVEVLDELPERLVVGTGASGQMRPASDTIDFLKQRGIHVDVRRPTKRFASSPNWILRRLRPPSTSPVSLRRGA